MTEKRRHFVSGKGPDAPKEKALPWAEQFINHMRREPETRKVACQGMFPNRANKIAEIYSAIRNAEMDKKWRGKQHSFKILVLYGDTGVGKTTQALAGLQKCNVPYYKKNCCFWQMAR